MSGRFSGFVTFVSAMLILTACIGGIAPIQPIAEAGGGQRLPLRNEVVSNVTRVADGSEQAGVYANPTDAAPNADGTMIYFTALGAEQPGLYRVAAKGGEVVALAQGAPLITPLGLVVSADGQTIYVADSAAGQVFAVPAAGGAPQPLAGATGSGARALALSPAGDGEALYLSGVDPGDGAPAVMRVQPDGGLNIVVKGNPLVEPGGLAIAGDGTLYVADRLAAGDGLGSIFRVKDGTLATVAAGVQLGNPVGLALTSNDALLLASALNPLTGRAQVLLVDLASGEKAIINRVIEANRGSGGVHRAADTNVFAWADFRGSRGGRGDEGGVYVISP